MLLLRQDAKDGVLLAAVWSISFNGLFVKARKIGQQ